MSIHHLSLVVILPGNEAGIATPDQSSWYHGWVDVHDVDHFVFEYTGCRGAHVVLAGIPGTRDKYAYHLGIGEKGNTISTIRSSWLGTIKAQVGTPKIVDCKESRPFWIGWPNGRLQVGRGYIFGENRFLSWNDPNPYPVNAIMVTTGWGTTGMFRHTEPKGESQLILNTCKTRYLTILSSEC